MRPYEGSKEQTVLKGLTGVVSVRSCAPHSHGLILIVLCPQPFRRPNPLAQITISDPEVSICKAVPWGVPCGDPKVDRGLGGSSTI